MPESTPTWIVVFDDGTNRTYGMIEVATTVQVPADVMDAEDSELAIQEYLDAHPEDGEPVVPLGELLDSVKLALESHTYAVDFDTTDDTDTLVTEVEATVLDYVTNNWGEA